MCYSEDDQCIFLQEHKKYNGLAEIEAKVKYTHLCRSLKTYGITFFLVKVRNWHTDCHTLAPFPCLSAVQLSVNLSMNCDISFCPPTTLAGEREREKEREEERGGGIIVY